MSIELQFRNRIHSAGINPPDVINSDGSIHRFSTNGKKQDKTGWYVLFNDGVPAGAFGDWRMGINENWRADIGREYTSEEKKQYALKMKQIKATRELEKKERQADAMEKANQILRLSKPCTHHPYLEKKQVKPHGVLQYKGNIIIPVYNDGIIQSLQIITPEGKKSFLLGGKVQGGYYPIGKIENSKTLYVSEGFATGASIHETTGEGTIVAFNSGNLESVTKFFKKKFPENEIIICGDNDIKTEKNTGKNPGKEAAIKTSKVTGAKVSLCPINSDYNDLMVSKGVDDVKKSLNQFLKIETNPYDGWEEPIPIKKSLLPVKSFDFDLLPEQLRLWVMDIAERMQCPPDYPAIGVMTVTGALLGRKIGIYPKQNDNWFVVPNLWGMAIGRPSELKSPSLKEIINIPIRLEIAAKESFNEEKAGFERSLVRQELKKEQAKQAAKKAIKEGKKDCEVDEIIASAEDPTLIEPTRKRYIVHDATIEKLGEILNENPNGVLLFRDELFGFLKTINREDRSNDRAFYLECWDGTGRYTYDRIGRGTIDCRV